MASNGIKDRVAIVGMGCTRFGERFDKSADDLMVEASNEAFASASCAVAKGLGIPDAETGRVFERYRRVGDSESSQAERELDEIWQFIAADNPDGTTPGGLSAALHKNSIPAAQVPIPHPPGAAKAGERPGDQPKS